MRHPSHALIAGLALAGLLAVTFAAPATAEAQGALGRLRERAKQKVEQKAGDKVDTAIDRAVDGTPKSGTAAPTNAAGGAAGSAAAPAASAAAAATAAQRPGEGAWSNYDFIPGERVLFAEDFSRDRVGNFPQRLEFLGGNAEVVEAGGVRYLRASSPSRIAVKLPEALPERFTIEYDMTVPSDWQSILFFSGEGVRDLNAAPGGACCYVPTAAVFISSAEVGLRRDRESILSKRQIGELLGAGDKAGKLMRIRMHVDGKYVKLYVNETRMANVPSLEIPRTNKLYFDLNVAHADVPILLGNLSINAGGRDMYDALSADGRVATQGIFFDTGSDRIRPESTPTLNEIRDMLKQHADLSLMIEGHTDNVGQAASNLTLSEKRAAAVRSYLVAQGIDASRLQSKGLGDTKPAGKNDTAEGRQTNRRVELVKI